MKIRKAKVNDLEIIMNIRFDASSLLKANNIDQWQYEYPSKNDFINDISLSRLYVVELNNEVVGMASITDLEEPTYEIVYDGVWTYDKPYLVVHRLAVKASYYNAGVAKSLLNYAKELGKQKGIKSIKVDTHPKNTRMQKLLESLNYRKVGIIYLNVVDGDKTRIAYEYLID